ncbi:MAG: hypothetical protein R3B57_07430 [Phycisphaerales bacterium]
MGESIASASSVVHLLEPPRARGGRDRGRESSLLAFAHHRHAGLVEPGRVVLLGDQMSREAALAHGLAWDRVLTPVAGRLGPSWPAIRREIAGAKLVRCWSVGALRMVGALAGLSRVGGVRATLLEAPRGARDRRMITRLGARLDRVDVFDEQDGAAWREVGVPSERVHVHDPADTPPLPSWTTQRIEITGRRPGQLVLTTLGDHPGDSDARRLSFLLAILSVGDYVALGLCPAGAHDLEAGRRYHRMLGERFDFQISSRPTIELLRAADVCVWPDPTEREPARGARALLRAAADRLGVEIIDPPEYANPAGPTPPEMVRPALRLFTGAREAASTLHAEPVMAGSGR